ncbi:hypothetical protein ACFWF7_11125 [Nocardia sp. NPDC060256]|uniref:hypothetical protein n=1 Tax=unclassified Nocardia TaxID=2637762 RepID=UPI003653694E
MNAKEAIVRVRLSALLVTGFSALLISGVASPHLAYADTSAADRADELENSISKAKWGQLVDRFCKKPINPKDNLKASRADFSDAGINAYDKALHMSPLELTQDPYKVARARTMVDGKYGNFAPTPGFTDEDTLRLWRALVCEVAAYKRQWNNEFKAATEKYGKQMKPEYEDDEAVLKLFEDKYKAMDDALKLAGK